MAGRGSSASARRSAARLAAVQALYQRGVTGISTEPLLGEFVRHRLDGEIDGEALVPADRPLFANIVRGVVARRPSIETTIEAALSAPWSSDRLELLLHEILAAGCWELMFNPDVDAPIIIKDYVNVAHAFFDGSEPGMVNGVLDRIAHAVRPGIEADRGDDA